MRSKRAIVLMWLAIGAVLVGLAGCGDDDEDQGARPEKVATASTTGSDQQQITTLIQDYMSNPDAGKCDRVLSDRYLLQNWSGGTPAKAKEDCKRRPPAESTAGTEITVEQIKITGSTATALGRSEEKGRGFEFELVKQGDAWKIDLVGVQ